jgi:hypothetical protein
MRLNSGLMPTRNRQPYEQIQRHSRRNLGYDRNLFPPIDTGVLRHRLPADRRNRGAGASAVPEGVQTMNETNKTNEPTDAEIEQFLFNPTMEQMQAFGEYHKARLAKLGKEHDFGVTIWPEL